MYYKVVTCRASMHLRPASEVSKIASTFKAKILLKELNGEKSVDAKNIIDITRSNFQPGDEIIVSAIGEDEREAVESVSIIIESTREEEF